MNHFGLTGWRWTRPAWVAVICAITLTSPTVLGQGKDMGAGHCTKHGNYRGASCPGCLSSAGSSAGSGGMSSQDQIALQAAGMLGTMLGEMLRGDPQRDAQLAAQAQERALAAQRAAELAAAEAARKKQVTFNRLRGSLKLDAFDGDAGGGLLLKGTGGGSGGSLALKLDDADVGTAPETKKTGNALGLKLEDDDMKPQPTQAVANNNPVNLTLPNTDAMVVDLRKTPLARNSGEKPALKQSEATTAPAAAPEASPAPAAEPEAVSAAEPETAAPPTPTRAPDIESGVVRSAAKKTINILDRTVSNTLESLITSQSGESIGIDSELSEIKAMLTTPASGKKDARTVMTISLGHQKSDKSGDKQSVGQILVVRNEETGEVHIDVMQEQTGKTGKQSIIHIDRFGDIVMEESR